MDDREGNSVAGTPSQSPQLDCSNNNSRGAASSRPGSRAGSVVSDSGNGAGLLLRTGKGSPTGQDAERSSTPKTVLPPIGASLTGCSAESGGETSPLSPPSTGTKTPEPASESVMDKTPGTGDSVPQIVRSFKRETTPESPSSSSGYKRSVSFVTEQRTSYDGREVSLHTLETQTDWDWVEDAILDESVRILEARPQPPVHVGESEDSDKTDGRENSSELLQQSLREAELDGFEQSEEEGPTPYPYRNDQYGVPILDLSSDSEDSSDEDTRKSKPNEDKLLPSVGPPQILQYIRESEKGELSSMNVQVGDLDTMGYAQDEQGKVHGYFSGTCEFCLKPILPFPTPEQQQQQPPEELFCCEEYRRFIEFTIEEDSIGPPSQSLIDVKPHPHFGSKQARKMAQQKAQQRMRERELLRQQQNMVMQNQTYFQKPRQPKTPGGASPAGQIKDGQRSAKGVFGGSELGSERPAMAALNFFAPDQKGMPLVTTAADGDTTDHPDRVAAPPSTSIRDRSGNSGNSDRLETDGLVVQTEITPEAGPGPGTKGKKRRFTKLPASDTSSKESGNAGPKTKPADSLLTSSSEVARQMKTINYQLSSQRCLEEGWTVRPPSPLMVNETDDVFIPEALDLAFAATGKVRRRELIQKFYEDGQPFITIFPDGSGNVFYSSGKVAVVISSTGPGQFMYVILDDAMESSSENPVGCPPQVLGVFRSDGKASCCYTNGNIRLFLDQYGGIELDRIGAKKRRWTWKDTETHVHAPPFQPVCFALSIHIAIRVMSQENISLTFRCGSRSCRFPVGSKLKLVAPENIPPKEIDDNILFINEMKVNTDSLLNKISNLLRFPNSPKVEKMLPPLHITSKIHKNQKLRVEQGAALAAAKAKASKPRPIRAVVVS